MQRDGHLIRTNQPWERGRGIVRQPHRLLVLAMSAPTPPLRWLLPSQLGQLSHVDRRAIQLRLKRPGRWAVDFFRQSLAQIGQDRAAAR
jgi:hypothetical protein